MKPYQVWLNGKVVKDFTYRSNAINHAKKLAGKCDPETDVLYVESIYKGSLHETIDMLGNLED